MLLRVPSVRGLMVSGHGGQIKVQGIGQLIISGKGALLFSRSWHRVKRVPCASGGVTWSRERVPCHRGLFMNISITVQLFETACDAKVWV